MEKFEMDAETTERRRHWSPEQGPGDRNPVMPIRVVARRSGEWWAIDVPDYPEVHTQARNLTDVRSAAADALSMWLERAVVVEDIDVETID
jgi:predicted RNase H-like HicB family nuclease